MGFFDTLSMVPLRIRQTEQPLLQKITILCQQRETTAVRQWMPYSFSFQNAKAMFCRPWVSETPAMPSSPHLNVLDLAWSCVKSKAALSSGIQVEGNHLRLQASPFSLLNR